MDIRTLNDADLPALERLLAPTETSSLFLLGNAREAGIDDRGGGRNGCWIGAFDGGELAGVIAWFRGSGSVSPACGGHAARLVPAMLERVGKPRVLVGTADRVEEALPHQPFAVGHLQRERLLVLRWSDYLPRPLPAVRPLLPEEAPAAAEAQAALHRESGLPTDPAVNLAGARARAAAGGIQSVWEAARLVAMSTDATSSGRFVHVGATWCAPAMRQRGYAGACVTAVLDEARRAGRASEGASLFTGTDNLPALRLYDRLGFREDADWQLAFLA